MSCLIHSDGLAKPRLQAGAPRNVWLANRTLRNMNAGGRATPAALTQQHIVMFKPRSLILFGQLAWYQFYKKIFLELRTVLIPVLSRFQILVGGIFEFLRILLKLSKKA